MMVVTNRAHRERQIMLRREAMRILLTLPPDTDEADEILRLAQELLREWLQQRGWPSNQ